MGPNTFPNAFRVVGNLAQATVGATSSASTAAPSGVTVARVLCLTQPICVAIGRAATANDYYLAAGQEALFLVAPGETVNYIRASGTDGAARVSWIAR